MVYPDHYGKASKLGWVIPITLALALLAGVVAVVVIPTLETQRDNWGAFTLFFLGAAICPLTWLVAFALDRLRLRLLQK